MKITTGCFLFLLVLSMHSISFAQQNTADLRGEVLTDVHRPAENATVVLLRSKDSSVVSSAVTRKDGQYKFAAVSPGSYLLLVSKLGYLKIHAGPYELVAGKEITAAPAVLEVGTQQLNEVSVTAERPAVEVRPGKIILNIQNNTLAAGNSAFDILRQSPGVRIDVNNAISIIGRQPALITIDGKTTNLSGEDLISVLRTLQASSIDRIELITSGSAKYDAATGGIINIVLKKGNNLGANATVNGGVGYGKYRKFNGGILFNDRTDKFNIFGNYNYANNKSFHDFTTDRNIGFDNVISDYHVDYHAVSTTVSNTFGVGADYFLTSSQTIGFLVNGSVSDINIVKNNSLRIYDQSVFDSVITTNSVTNRHISRINYNLNYSNKLDKAGKTLTADLDYSTYNRSSVEDITNGFFNADGSKYRDTLWFKNSSPSNIHIWLSRIDFTDPLSKTAKLEAGLKYSNVSSVNNLVFSSFINGAYRVDPTFTNDYNYSENVNAAYVNYADKFDKLSVTAGLRAEQTISKGNSVTLNQVVKNNYLNLFPQALLTYQQDEKNEFTLSYTRGIKRPDYEILNPFLYYVDLYDFRTGNPYLKPEFSNTVELSYAYNKVFLVTLYSNIVSNAYQFPLDEQNDSTKLNITTNKNFGRIYNYGLRFNAPVVFTSWWNADFGTDAAYQRYVAYPVNGNLDKGTQDIIINTTQNFVITKTLTANLFGFYESPCFYGINQFKSHGYVNAGISQQLFNKRGSLKFAVNDIFNTERDRSYTNYQNLDITINNKTETRVARLTFTYRFGNISVKNVIHHTGNEDELKRTSATN